MEQGFLKPGSLYLYTGIFTYHPLYGDESGPKEGIEIPEAANEILMFISWEKCCFNPGWWSAKFLAKNEFVRWYCRKENIAGEPVKAFEKAKP